MAHNLPSALSPNTGPKTPSPTLPHCVVHFLAVRQLLPLPAVAPSTKETLINPPPPAPPSGGLVSQYPEPLGACLAGWSLRKCGMLAPGSGPSLLLSLALGFEPLLQTGEPNAAISLPPSFPSFSPTPPPQAFHAQRARTAEAGARPPAVRVSRGLVTASHCGPSRGHVQTLSHVWPLGGKPLSPSEFRAARRCHQICRRLLLFCLRALSHFRTQQVPSNIGPSVSVQSFGSNQQPSSSYFWLHSSPTAAPASS